MRISTVLIGLCLCLCLLLFLHGMASAATVPVAATPAAPVVPAVKDPVGCKLIKADAYAYGIDHTGATDPKADLGAYLGEPGEGYGVVGATTDKSDGNRDAGFVWHSAGELIVAFRGTLPDAANTADSSKQMLSVEDWINDADYSPQVDPKLGQVHAGFKGAFDQVWPAMQQEIVAWQKAGKLGPATKVYVTGHSKGGAMAMLAAMTLTGEKLTPVTELVTFGAPRVGGPDFAAKYAAAGIDGVRYENYQDLVPHVPLNTLELSLAPLLRRLISLKGEPNGDYVSVGKLRYIDSDGSIQAPADAAAEDDLEKSRLTDFAPMIFQSPEDTAQGIVQAHSIAPDSAYYKAVCGASVGK
ncbi:MAG TPA: lipase family protein [Gammaproteobacteria bacterium]|jgi:hypothetical protein